jgi:histidinol-phosphate aminotransferase
MPESFLKKALRGFEPYVPGEQPPEGEGWTKLNTNESPLPPSPRVIEAIQAAAGDSLRLYPSATAAPARAAIAAHLGVEAEQVVVGNGADEIIEMCFRAFVGRGDHVAYPTPTYPVFEPLCHVHEAIPAPHPSGEGWTWASALIEDRAPLKFIVNPNSPTGTWMAESAVEDVVARSHGVVVLDEAYADFAPESCLGLLAKHRNLIIIRTFSKSYALAGMRIGFAVGDPEVIAALAAVRDSYNMDRLAIVAAVAAIQDEDHHRKIIDFVLAERAWLADRLREMHVDVAPSATNFLFVQPPPGNSAAAVADALRERRILIRHYDREPIAGWLRITIGTRDQHEHLLATLKEIFV